MAALTSHLNKVNESRKSLENGGNEMTDEEITKIAAAIRYQFMPPRSVSTLIPDEITKEMRELTKGHAWTYQVVVPISHGGLNIAVNVRIDGQIDLTISTMSGYRFWTVTLSEYEEK
jgi:hypothetical protein